ncbi:4Fe-4S dicluster domain-containing protein [Desulfovibrio oxyclinae]|jgi:Fe-S-cluster-containing hydrogenase component 2|uniref:4Fe-4S dicluster domain-containing protein n=1 Tax=Desulfovibrio oxyclinae TaxID=63560 RepID=UPI0003757E82|nr:4Fe-4S dicluster domain-containing protein [Desulfovibrio oxyclinae]
MEGKTLYIDYSKCIGCETCEAVCGFIHDTPRIHMTRTRDGLMVPLYCRHCEDAPCARACKKGALVRDRDGALVLQPMLCRGCETRQCLLACPFGAIFLTSTGVAVRKCDLCASRRDIGLGPACVEMCPCGAVMHVERDTVPELCTQESEEALKRVIAHIRPAVKRPK